jgi:putative spermidine/putrescine transport system permease protein
MVPATKNAHKLSEGVDAGGIGLPVSPSTLSIERRFDQWSVLLLPGLIALIALFFLPLILLALNSLHASAGLAVIAPGWTLENYVSFLTDPFYLGILLDTFVLGLIVATICMFIGYPVAYFLVRSRWRWKSVLVFLVISPLMISTVIRNLGWIPVLGNNGLVNGVLMGLGIVHQPIQLIGNITGVVIGLVHALLPFMVLSIMTVVQRIEPELEEASITLGATPIVTFWRVLLPMSRPGILSGYLLVFTLVLAAFVTPGMLGGKRVLVMSIFIEQQIRAVMNYAFAATAAVILMIAAGTLSFVALRLSSKEG